MRRTDDAILEKLWEEYRNSQDENEEDQKPRVYDVFYAGWLEDKYICLVQDIEKVLEKL